jgi:uncharacterized protein (TIGR03435 family)
MIGKVLAVGLVCAGMAMGQTATAPVASTAAVDPAASGAAAAPAKAYTFDVVSIRQNNTPLRGQRGIPQSGPTADGYRLTNDNLLLVLLAAYVPQAGGATFYGLAQIKGIPDWSERYDIDARISDADRAAWQNPAEQKVMLQAMLQAMLADRCKLAVHREIKEVPVYSLVVAKGGPKFKETDPTVEHPAGYKLPWGGEITMTFSNDGGSYKMYGIPMASFATWFSSWAGRPVQDKTGLTGKYDLTMKQPALSGPAPGEQQDETASDPGGSASYSMVKDLGLKLESAKGQVETLVIDHIERPSEN